MTVVEIINHIKEIEKELGMDAKAFLAEFYGMKININRNAGKANLEQAFIFVENAYTEAQMIIQQGKAEDLKTAFKQYMAAARRIKQLKYGQAKRLEEEAKKEATKTTTKKVENKGETKMNNTTTNTNPLAKLTEDQQEALRTLFDKKIEEAISRTAQNMQAEFNSILEQRDQRIRELETALEKALTKPEKPAIDETSVAEEKKEEENQMVEKEKKEAEIIKMYDSLKETIEKLRKEASNAIDENRFNDYNKIQEKIGQLQSKVLEIGNKFPSLIYSPERVEKLRKSVANGIRVTADTTHKANASLIDIASELIVQTTDLLADTVKSTTTIASNTAHRLNDSGRDIAYKIADNIDARN